jgi:hypothetical protein
VLVGATVAVSIPQALKALGSEDAARAALPFLVLFPGAVWIGASADGVFAGVVSAGLALLALAGRPAVPAADGNRAGTGTRIGAAAGGGLLLGFALYLSYGFVLVGLLALAVIMLSGPRGPGAGRLLPGRFTTLIIAAVGVGAVVLAFTAAGFWWLDGYHLVVVRYYQGWAAERPYGYWVWANPASLVLSAGPAVAPALRRAWSTLLPPRPFAMGSRRFTAKPPPVASPASGAGRSPVVWLSLAAALAVVIADLSGMSKAEVERIWLPFAVWLLTATACLPVADRRWWLAAQAGTALAVNHLLWTVS